MVAVGINNRGDDIQETKRCIGLLQEYLIRFPNYRIVAAPQNTAWNTSCIQNVQQMNKFLKYGVDLTSEMTQTYVKSFADFDFSVGFIPEDKIRVHIDQTTVDYIISARIKSLNC